MLSPDGLLAFSVERDDSASLAPALQPSLRYAHSEAYLRALAATHGLEVQRSLQAPIREDQRESIPGLYAVLQRVG